MVTIRARDFAGIATVIGATLAMPVSASPAAAAHVGAPGRLRPGSIVRVQIGGYPPGSRVRVQLATRRSLHDNCCVSLTYPSEHAPGVFVNQDGSATIRWRVPVFYARCVSSICSSPEYERFRLGESVLVDVSTTDDTVFAYSTDRIT
jgi:hypothetical protein